MEWHGKVATKYTNANQQCNKDNNSKGHSRGKNIICYAFSWELHELKAITQKVAIEEKTLLCIFMGAPCLELHHQLVPNFGAQRVKLSWSTYV
jgi:hypothetical protein